LAFKPVISIVMPVYNPTPAYLKSCLDSVLAQVYPHWQLCIADDASTDPEVQQVLAEYQAKDPRIKVMFRPHNGHICAASNSALKLVQGEYVALLDHDDCLTPDALWEVASVLNVHPDAGVIYSDEDKVDAQGQRFDPHFKPDWNPDLLLAQNYISHLCVYKTALVKAAKTMICCCGLRHACRLSRLYISPKCFITGVRSKAPLPWGASRRITPLRLA
jgi:glycosyltransferase involved in cell wall biosynthesis